MTFLLHFIDHLPVFSIVTSTSFEMLFGSLCIITRSHVLNVTILNSFFSFCVMLRLTVRMNPGAKRAVLFHTIDGHRDA